MTELWTMRDGTQIAVKDMGDKHLVNTFRMVSRAIPPSLYWAAIFQDEIGRRGIGPANSRYLLSEDDEENLEAYEEAAYDEWRAEHD